jgi:hypothetical protein
MVVLRSSETSVLTIATWRNIPKGGILHIHRREDLKSYIYHVDFVVGNLEDEFALQRRQFTRKLYRKYGTRCNETNPEPLLLLLPWPIFLSAAIVSGIQRPPDWM